MKRQRFALGNVLRYYELQKDRAEYELQQAGRLLRVVDTEIERLDGEIANVATVMYQNEGVAVSTAAWLACYRNADHLGRLQELARLRRQRQAEIVATQREARKKWAVAEETLRSLRQAVDAFNHAQAAKGQQEILDEAVIRKWLENCHEIEQE